MAESSPNCRPQCSAEAVAHLLRETKAVALLHDERYSRLAEGGLEALASAIPAVRVWTAWAGTPSPRACLPLSPLTAAEEADTLCIVFHSSGSTGTPKPIYQRHRMWTEGLPSMPPTDAAFTTTPLYHGGASDLLRAFMSGSTLYLFTDRAPVTAANLCRSLEAIAKVERVAYFLSVPYILKMAADDANASEWVARMDMVSVGGAPLSVEDGEEMVKKLGWRLVSRFGSSECGCPPPPLSDFPLYEKAETAGRRSPHVLLARL